MGRNKREIVKIVVASLFILLIAACSSGPSSRGGSNIRLNPKERAQVVNMAVNQVGVPYRYGSMNPSEGLDCSGLIAYAYNSVGVQLPRSTSEQVHFFRNQRRLERGDIIFFKINHRTVSHAGIYLGDNKMVHAPGSGRRVEVTNINIPYWQKRIHKFGRL